MQVDSVVFHSAVKYSACEIHFDFAQSFFNLNFQEILTGICGCLLLNFAENNGYNILLPNIIDTSITHAGYVHLSARRNPWGSFIVQRSTVITALLGNCSLTQAEKSYQNCFSLHNSPARYRFLCVKSCCHLTGTLWKEILLSGFAARQRFPSQYSEKYEGKLEGIPT